MADLARWLDAALHMTDYRPVDLSVRICSQRRLYRVQPLVDTQVTDASNSGFAAFVGAGRESEEGVADTETNSTATGGRGPMTLLQDEDEDEDASKTKHRPLGDIFDAKDKYGAHRLKPSSILSSSESRSHGDELNFISVQVEHHTPVLLSSAASRKLTNGVAVGAARELWHQFHFERMVQHSDDVAGDESVTRCHVIGAVGASDTSGELALCLETVADGKSVLVFCSSKKGCTEVAARISEEFRMWQMQAPEMPRENLSFSEAEKATVDLGPQVPPTTEAPISSMLTSVNHAKMTGRRKLLNELRLCPVGLCPVLASTIRWGVAYHHSGLTADERRIVETGFR